MPTDQIFIALTAGVFPRKALEYAQKAARGFSKEICLISLDENPDIAEQAAGFQTETSIKINFVEGKHAKDFAETLEEHEASMVIFELSGQNRNIAFLLKISRELRIPYIFVKDSFSEISFQKVLVPVTFLAEEREKGRFASGLGRFMHSEILLLTANDYGSKAQTNTNAIKTLLDKFGLKYEAAKAQKDSYKAEMEAVQTASHYGATLAVITASREYGLDDIIFGAKEQHIVKRAEIPVMLLNPRGDLYVLCD
jgi:nucleotide-binding universal stress UspA family protein